MLISDLDITSMRGRFPQLGDVHAGIDGSICRLDAVVEMAERDAHDRGPGDAPHLPNYPKMRG